MKQKTILRLLGLSFLIVLLAASCRKTFDTPHTVDLGVKSTSTAITKIIPALTTGNITVEFATTPGAKYSVQIVPFGSEDPSEVFGFTAESNTTTKKYNLSGLNNGDYTLVFIDVKGTEIKSFITIKK